MKSTSSAKHFDIYIKFICHHAQAKLVQLSFVTFDDMMVDLLTKKIPAPRILDLHEMYWQKGHRGWGRGGVLDDVVFWQVVNGLFLTTRLIAGKVRPYLNEVLIQRDRRDEERRQHVAPDERHVEGDLVRFVMPLHMHGIVLKKRSMLNVFYYTFTSIAASAYLNTFFYEFQQRYRFRRWWSIANKATGFSSASLSSELVVSWQHAWAPLSNGCTSFTLSSAHRLCSIYVIPSTICIGRS